jgi:CRISPR-associated protein Csc2
MSMLETLQSEFHTAFPRLASGKYVHFLMLRHSQSFPVFQTDGVLNTARTQAGLVDRESISRLVMFKRKQTTPERLAGRELLRSLELTSGTVTDSNYCEYNSEKSCKQCPDCVIYGFAIGDSGSERSKVYSDSAFSLSPYEVSHKSLTFNAPSETGTMSERVGDQVIVRSSINEQDHILPEVTFPTVETLRDPTLEGFTYVLGNLLRTHRYGAQETRTGTMNNHLVGIIITDGDVFSNLHFTQALHDALKEEVATSIETLCQKATDIIPDLLQQESVRVKQVVTGESLKTLLAEVREIYQTESTLSSTMSALYQQTKVYAETYGAITSKKKQK